MSVTFSGALVKAESLHLSPQHAVLGGLGLPEVRSMECGPLTSFYIISELPSVGGHQPLYVLGPLQTNQTVHIKESLW